MRYSVYKRSIGRPRRDVEASFAQLLRFCLQTKKTKPAKIIAVAVDMFDEALEAKPGSENKNNHLNIL